MTGRSTGKRVLRPCCVSHSMEIVPGTLDRRKGKVYNTNEH